MGCYYTDRGELREPQGRRGMIFSSIDEVIMAYAA